MCGRLVNIDTVARVLADYYHLHTDVQLTALDEALSRVPAETVGKELFGNSEQLDIISRRAAIDALAKHEKSKGHNYTLFVDIVSECEEIIRNLPPAQPKLQPTCNQLATDTISRAAAINAICKDGTQLERQGQYTMTMVERKQRDVDILEELPSATDTNVATTDTISRAAVVDAIEGVDWYHQNQHGEMVHGANPDEHQAWYKAEDIYKAVESVPSAQQDIIACGDCKHWICHDRKCGFWNHGVKPLDWCCHAERRTE